MYVRLLGTIHKEYLVVFIVVQSVVGIDTVVLKVSSDVVHVCFVCSYSFLDSFFGGQLTPYTE